jgi:hypothetical protein
LVAFSLMPTQMELLTSLSGLLMLNVKKVSSAVRMSSEKLYSPIFLFVLETEPAGD